MSYFKIEGCAPLNGSITPSGNKNEALPTLMTCLLTDEPVILKRIPQIEDVLTVCSILKKLGVRVEWLEEDCVMLEASSSLDFKTPDKELCSRIRASILLIGPMLARFKKVELPLPGGDIIGARKIDSHFESIKSLGGKIELSDAIYASIDKAEGCEIFLDEPSVTATENILLLACLAEGETVLHNAACEPHIKGLCNLLKKMGASIEGLGTNRLTIKGVSKLSGAKHVISPDFMEVGSFLCLSAITEGRIIIADIVLDDLQFIIKTLRKIGIETEILSPHAITVRDTSCLMVKPNIEKFLSSNIYSSPWPAFPTDLMSVAIVAATQAYGTILFHEKMFEGRMFFTDKLAAMGANIIICDPHRVVVTGPKPLYGCHLSSPDVRAGMALLMATLIAKGKSEIHSIYQIDRGYLQIEKKIANLGGRIKRINNH